MGKVESSLRDVELKLICELVKNSRRSDRDLARTIGVSQPTVTRIRTRLEKEGLIEYSGVPDLKRLGFEIVAVFFARWKHPQYPDTKVEKAREFIGKHPNIIFVSTGRGLGYDRVGISVHKSYSEYAEYMNEVKTGWGEFMTISDSFLISLNSDNMLRRLSFKYLVDCLKKETSE
jgi:DNA-binding Lrp family transcriptional regulator